MFVSSLLFAHRPPLSTLLAALVMLSLNSKLYAHIASCDPNAESRATNEFGDLDQWMPLTHGINICPLATDNWVLFLEEHTP